MSCTLLSLTSSYAQVTDEKTGKKCVDALLNEAQLGAVLEILKSQVDVLALRTKPSWWQQFDALESLIANFNSVRADATPKVSEDEFRQFVQKEFLPAVQIASGVQYEPTAYAMQTIFRKQLSGFLELLSPSLRFTLPTLPPDNRPQVTAQQTEILMNRLKARYAELFPTTGHASLEAYETAVRQSGHPELIDSFDLLKNVGFELSIRRPTNGRFWLPKVGFHNQFLTGSSKGYYTPEGRNHVEAGWTATDYDEYINYNIETKPKYGSFRPLLTDTVSVAADAEKQYGDDIYLIRLERIKDRLTFNLGDSNGLRARNHRSSGRWEDVTWQAEAWDQLFIPWDYRTLIAPYLNRTAFGKAHDASNSILKKTWKLDYIYFEIQIFGELTLDDIHTLIFTLEPPDDKYYAELKARGIEIYDGRQNPPQPYKR